MSVQVVNSTGAPLGGLYSHLSSSPCIPQTSYHLQTFSDDSAFVGCQDGCQGCVSGGQETEYKKLVDHFAAICWGSIIRARDSTK